MPGSMDGLDLVTWAHQHRPELPIVVVSGYNEPALAASANSTVGFVRKPYNP
jgi:CheY-like chemotaxis protein